MTRLLVLGLVGMLIAVGSFNVNNLFLCYNFSGEIGAIAAGETEVDTTLAYTFAGPHDYALRTYEGRLVKGNQQRSVRPLPSASRRWISTA